jgi:hypothetical protein
MVKIASQACSLWVAGFLFAIAMPAHGVAVAGFQWE